MGDSLRFGGMVFWAVGEWVCRFRRGFQTEGAEWLTCASRGDVYARFGPGPDWFSLSVVSKGVSWNQAQNEREEG